ncbi:hypothetical protein AAGG74_15530 [Bacillus mexicanus]|uniref:hypothetical protein n=1 Tax=Bacillus mexicanus TaxID=2834415 RepID=UPI003D1F56AE
MNKSDIRVIVLTLICSIIASVVFFTVGSIFNHYNLKTNEPVIEYYEGDTPKYNK